MRGNLTTICSSASRRTGARESRALHSPLDDRARPGEATAKYDHENEIALFDSSAAVGFVQSNRDGRGRSVAVLVEIHVELFDRNLQTIGDAFDDPEIGLMRDDTGNVIDGQSGFLQSLSGSVEHGYDRLFVNFLAGH